MSSTVIPLSVIHSFKIHIAVYHRRCLEADDMARYYRWWVSHRHLSRMSSDRLRDILAMPLKTSSGVDDLIVEY